MLFVICNTLFQQLADHTDIINTRKSEECLMINFSQNVSCCLARILRSENNASLWSLVIESNQLEKRVGTKKFLHFRFFGKIRSAWCVILVKLYFLRLHVQLSSRLETYLLSLVTNIVASEMGRLALPLLASKTFDSVASPQYLKTKGFAFCWFNTKLFGRTSSAKLFYSQNKLILLLPRKREYIMTKAIPQKGHITLLRIKANTFGAFWRNSLVLFFNHSLSLREGLGKGN